MHKLSIKGGCCSRLTEWACVGEPDVTCRKRRAAIFRGVEMDHAQHSTGAHVDAVRQSLRSRRMNEGEESKSARLAATRYQFLTPLTSGVMLP